MEKLPFLIDWYNREEERKTSLETSLNIPIGILTVLFAVQFFVFRDFDFDSSASWERFAFAISIIASAVSALITAFYVLKSYHNFGAEYRYTGLPYPSQLFQHQQELIEFYKENASDFANVTGETKFEEYLVTKLSEHIDRNAFNNDKKSQFLHISKRFIFISILTLVVSFIPFLSNVMKREAKPQQIEIINLPAVSCYPNNEENTDQIDPAR